MYERILVATDGSELSAKTVAAALDFAAQLGSEVIAVTVTEPYSYACPTEYWPTIREADYDKWMKGEAAKRLEAVQTEAVKRGVPVRTVTKKSFSPAEVIVETAAAYDCGLIVMASHGRKGISAVLLGSETQKVLVHSRIPVLVYR